MPKQHNSKAVKRVFRKLEMEGYTITRRKSGSYRIDPPDHAKNQAPYNTHGTESSLHQIRRDFRKMYGLELRT